MIQAIKELGDTILKREGKTPLSTLVQNPKAEKVVAIVFGKKEDGFYFSEVKLEEFDSGKVDRYLYRKGSANGSNFTPTSKVTELEKTFNLKIKGWFEGMDLSRFEINSEEKVFLSDLKTSFIAAREEILKGIINYQNEKNSMLTVKIEDRYIGDYEVFQNYLLQAITKKDTKLAGNNGLCSLCNQTRDSVFDLDTFKFYTRDKPGFISGGFREEDAWKNYPVCNECKLSLEEGKKFLLENLRFSFYGLPYYIIPKFMVGGDEVKERIFRIFEMINKEEQNLKDKKEIVGRENRILKILSQEKDYLTFNFFFLSREQSGSVERILLLIEDVLPSRLRTIMEKKDEVDRVFGEKFKFHFGRIRRFFQKSDEGKRYNDLDKYFLEIVDKAFKDGKLDFHFMLQVVMNRIRKDFLNSETKDSFFFDVRDAMLDMLFFEKLGLIKFEEVIMSTEKFSSFFAKYGKSFSIPEARGIFLLGTMTELLLKEQEDKRQSKPFMKQLKSLKMNQKDIIGLLPKVQNKLDEYEYFKKRFKQKQILEAASYYLLEAGDKWKLSGDETNFFFACGMNLANEIKGIVYEEEPIEEEQNEQHNK